MRRAVPFLRATFTLIVLLSAACTPQGLRELYVPLAAGAGYGYAEQPLGDRRFQVAYDAPIDTAFSFTPLDKQRDLARAFDFALLRAADLAAAQGAPAFRVVDRVNDADVRNYPTRGDPFWFPGWRRPYYGYPWGYGPFYDDGYATLPTRVALTIELLPAVETGAYDVQNVQATIRARYAMPAA
jgi:hypothetical protein